VNQMDVAHRVAMDDKLQIRTGRKVTYGDPSECARAFAYEGDRMFREGYSPERESRFRKCASEQSLAILGKLQTDAVRTRGDFGHLLLRTRIPQDNDVL